MIKKIFYPFALLMGLAHYGNAQTPAISNFGNFSDSCIFNSTGHSAFTNGSVSNANAGLNVTTFWGDGTSSNQSVNTSGTQGWFGEIHNYALSGTYSVKAVLKSASNVAIDSSEITVDAYCYAIRGNLYKRIDANCTYDYGIDQLINTLQSIEVRKNNIPIDTFTANAFYYYKIPQADPTSEFSFHLLSSNNGLQSVCPSASNFYKVRLDTLNITNNALDYGFECNGVSSPDFFAYMSGILRFTNTSYLTINAGNASCTPQNGVVTVNIDPQYSYTGASIAPTSVSGNTVTWNLANLSATNYQNIWVYLAPVGTLTPGDSSCHSVSITPTAGDINVANNTYNYCDTIRASMDPNDKKVSPMGDIAAGQLLTYTINFENMGNDTAFNINVVDTLSSNLDASSFKLLASSHHVNTNMFDYGSSKIVRFDFTNIKLADKNHPQTNKGFIVYQAKAKTTLNKGDEVKNTAHIFFDINPAVITNTVVSKIPNPTSIKEISKADGLNVYPNPAKTQLFIENKNNLFNQVHIVNTLGQTIQENKLGKGMNTIALPPVSSGIYYLLISGPNGSRSLKITKE